MLSRRMMIGTGLAALTAPWLGSAAAARPVPEGVHAPLRLGMLTGGAVGHRHVLGARYRADQLNGGGMHGREQIVELLVRDAAGDPATAVSALLDEGVHAVIAELAESIVAQCQLACTPLIAPATADAPTQAYAFLAGPPNEQVVKALFAAAKAGGATTVGHLVLDRLATPGLLGAADAESVAQAVALTGTEQIPGDATDLGPSMAKLTAPGPDALLVTTRPPQAAAAVTAARDGGFTGPILLAPDGVQPGLKQENVKAVVPWVTLAESATDDVPNAAAVRRFASGFGGSADPAVGYGVDAVSLAHLAFLGERDRKAGREQLEQACCIGVCGAYAMSPGNHAGLDKKALVTAVLQGGVWMPHP